MTEQPVRGLDAIAEGCRQLEAGSPPPQVDAAVRSAARAAARRRRAAAWTIPAALAATVLVAFSLVVQVQRDEAVPGPGRATPTDEPAAAAILQEAAPAPPPSRELSMADEPAGKLARQPAAAVAERHALPPAAGSSESPEAWLERIEALEAAGRREEAELERGRLEAAHPGWLAEHAAQRD